MTRISNNTSSLYRHWILVLLIAAITGCSGEDGHEGGHHHSLIDKLKKEQRDSIHYEVSTEGLMTDIKKVLARVPEAEKEFYVLERQSMIQSAPCSNCHSVPLEKLQEGTKNTKKAHWNIDLIHANDQTMDCATCHNTHNLDELKTLTGKTLTFDHSYQQCGQCHSQQKKDWIGGAHGKRKAGWAPPRVVYNCTSCHNPHQPAFESRLPARLNTEKLKELNSN